MAPPFSMRLKYEPHRLVSAMDLADDIRSQIEIANNKQQLWDQGLAPEGKENTPEVHMAKHGHDNYRFLQLTII